MPGYTSFGLKILIPNVGLNLSQLEGTVNTISPRKNGESRQTGGFRSPTVLNFSPLRVALLLSLLLALLVSTGCTLQAPQDRPVEGQKLTLAPGFTGEFFDGEQVSLAQYRGKVVFLNFWASWCGPCRRETPMIEALWNDYKKTGDVVFLGVNIQDSRANAQAFMDEFSLTYPNLFDPTAKIAYLYGVTALPSTFIVDKKGELAERFVGALEGPGADEASLRRILDNLRKES